MQVEQKYKQMQCVYRKFVSSFIALDCHCLHWFSDQRRVWLGASSRCEYMAQNFCSVLTCSFYHVTHRLIRRKYIVNSWWRAKWWGVVRSLFSACMPGNKLGSAHYSCLVSLFTISCCAVFFKFHRFSIWILYLLVFFIYHTLKGSCELRYYLRRKSLCQILVKISGVKVAVYFCTKKYSTRWALGRFDGEVIRVNGVRYTYIYITAFWCFSIHPYIQQ